MGRLVARILLPHDFLTYKLTGRFVTDRGDASGTGYWSPTTGAYLDDVLALIDRDRDWSTVLPTVLGPFEAAGTLAGATVGPGTGDNMAAALGVGLTTGDAVVSAGTSGTAYAVCDHADRRPVRRRRRVRRRDGPVPAARLHAERRQGRSMPSPACSASITTSSIALARGRPRRCDADPCCRTSTVSARPNRPGATGVLAGLRTDVTREQLARAAVDGVACGLVDALDALRAHALVHRADRPRRRPRPAASPSAGSSPGSSTYRSW